MDSEEFRKNDCRVVHKHDSIGIHSLFYEVITDD